MVGGVCLSYRTEHRFAPLSLLCPSFVPSGTWVAGPVLSLGLLAGADCAVLIAASRELGLCLAFVKHVGRCPPVEGRLTDLLRDAVAPATVWIEGPHLCVSRPPGRSNGSPHQQQSLVS